MSSRKWTREEEIIVFNLYCKIPFKASSKNNSEVIKVAKLINRTPSAVNLKIGNFGSFDESLRTKGIVGLGHTSKLDKEIWDEFNDNWEKLVYESEQIINNLSGNPIDDEEILGVIGEDRETIVKRRINQSFFRKTVLSSYNNVCCITGIAEPKLLRASHIKPWKVSNQNEKVNPTNGLCLNALHDEAFDRGLITVLTDGKIVVSKGLKDIYNGEIINRYFYIYNNKKILFPEKFKPDKSFLEYHNDNIFEKWR